MTLLSYMCKRTWVEHSDDFSAPACDLNPRVQGNFIAVLFAATGNHRKARHDEKRVWSFRFLQNLTFWTIYSIFNRYPLISS